MKRIPKSTKSLTKNQNKYLKKVFNIPSVPLIGYTPAVQMPHNILNAQITFLKSPSERHIPHELILKESVSAGIIHRNFERELQERKLKHEANKRGLLFYLPERKFTFPKAAGKPVNLELAF